MKNIILPLIFITALFLASGCGGNVNLTGTVTFSDDGSPLPRGQICFTTPGFMARGEIKPDGTYVVGSITEKDGIPPGTYQVHIINSEKEVGTNREGLMLYEDVIDQKYTSASTSELSVVVDAKTRRHDIRVERPKTKN